MRKIIFVHDTPQILDYLQPFFNKMNQHWEILFFDNADFALAALSQEKFDMLVTEYGVIDAQHRWLISVAGKLHPEIIRIELPAQANQKIALDEKQTPGNPQAILSIMETMSRSFVLNDLLNDKKLQRLLSKIDRLPSLPALYSTIMKELESKDVSIKKVGETISHDIAMTAKILQLVNSAFFGLGNRISDPVHAVNMLGINTIKAMVLSIQIFEQFDNKQMDMDKLLHHSFIVGSFARAYALLSFKDKQLAEEAFTAGLLHDIGKLIIFSKFQKEYLAIESLVQETGCTVSEAEQQILGANHAQIGAYLLGLWGFASSIVEAVAFHHSPGKCAFRSNTPLVTVYAANVIEKHLQQSHLESSADLALDQQLITDLKLEETLQSWVKKSNEIITAPRLF